MWGEGEGGERERDYGNELRTFQMYENYPDLGYVGREVRLCLEMEHRLK